MKKYSIPSLLYKQAITGLFILLFIVACKTSSKVPKKSSSVAPMKEETRIAFEAALNDGMKYFIIEDYPEAIKSLERAAVLNKNSAAAYYTLGKLYLSQKDMLKALACTELAVEHDGTNKYYYEQLGHIYEYQKLYTNAEKVYKKLTLLEPNIIDYYYDLAAMDVILNKPEEALKTYSIIENKFGRSLELTRQKQQIYIHANKLDEAILEGSKLIAEFPDEADFKVAQAEFLYTNGKYEEAITLLKEVSVSHPENALVHLNLASVYESENKPELQFDELMLALQSNALDLDTELGAIAEYMKSVSSVSSQKNASQLISLSQKHYPKEAKLCALQGELLLKMGQHKEALVQFKKVVELGTGEYKNWIEILNLEYQTQQYDSLVLDTERALEVFPSQSAIWYYGGMGYFLKKDYTKAVTYLEEAKKLSASQVEVKTMSLSLLGDSYNELKNYKKSDEAYEEVLKLDRNNDHVLNNYSYFLSLRKEKLELAKDLSERLMKKYPGNPSYIDTYGWVLYQMKDYENAKKYLEIAVATKKDGTLLEHYGDVLYKLGDKENAISMWKEAKLIGGASELINKKIAEGKLHE